MKSYICVAVYQDSEIAIGEGSTHEYAVQECKDALIDSFYLMDEIYFDVHTAEEWE